MNVMNVAIGVVTFFLKNLWANTINIITTASIFIIIVVVTARFV